MTQAPPLGPIELEILRNTLTAAAAEMDVTVWRTSRSTIVRELLDYSTAVFDRDGYNVAQSARIPQHLNSMGAGLLTLVRDFLALERSFSTGVGNTITRLVRLKDGSWKGFGYSVDDQGRARDSITLKLVGDKLEVRGRMYHRCKDGA